MPEGLATGPGAEPAGGPGAGHDARGAEVVLEAIATTRAIRRYRPDPIPEADLSRILFAATRAPSGSNRQPVRFVVLGPGPEARPAREVLGRAFRAMWEHKVDTDGYQRGSGTEVGSPKARMAATMDHFVSHIEDAPTIVLVCTLSRPPTRLTSGASVYPACQNLLLAARALGYGGVLTVWHEAAEDELARAVGVPEGVRIAATVPLGRPAGRHGPVRRLPLAEVVYQDRWGTPAPWAVDPPGTRVTGGAPRA